MSYDTPEDHDTLPPSLDPEPNRGTVDPPRSLFGILGSLGPGLIIAGSIVGSGELIATTKTGAQAGMSLLWLIILGCIIKVFVQVELGRYALTHGETTLSALDQIPGPKFGVRWIVWYWVIMMIASMGQLGGIVGGVGQSLALFFPITGDYAQMVSVPATIEFQRYVALERDAFAGGPKLAALTPEQRLHEERFLKDFTATLERLGERGTSALQTVREGGKLIDPQTSDDRYWAIAFGIITAFLLFFGRYNTIQNVTTVFVVGFTFVTLVNVLGLQFTERWSISLDEFLAGLSFRLPSASGGKNPLHTALATFGIIGVGASELIAYPYWCVEKGYARFAGQRDESEGWAVRARGWMRVMHYDAFASLVVYTLATLAFYLLGVAVLSREGRDPEGMRMVSTLSSAYVPIFGEYARWLFLIGAFAVLYSTYLVANAGHARTIVDALKLFGVVPRHDEAAHRRTLKGWSFALPLICLMFFLAGFSPVRLVLISGMIQAVMLPMLAGAALYFRYQRTDPRLRPSVWWDVCLIISSLAMLVTGVWGLYNEIVKLRG